MLRKIMAKSFLVLAGLSVVVTVFVLTASPAAAHYDEDAKPGRDGYLDEDCHNSDGNADAVQSTTDREWYEGTAPSGEPIENLSDVAPDGHVEHSGGMTMNSGSENSFVSSHIHASTERSYKCWLRGVLSLPTTQNVLRTIGGFLTAYGVVRLIMGRLSKGGGGGAPGVGGGPITLILAGVALILAEQLMTTIIFTITDWVEAIFETLAGAI